MENLPLIKDPALAKATALAGIGFVLELARHAAAQKLRPWQASIGRAVLTGGLTSGAGLLLLFVPDVDFVVVLALAGIMGSLGTDYVECQIKKFISRRLK